MKTNFLAILFFCNLSLIGQEKNQYENFSSSPESLILSYDSFGPQVLAYDFIGYEWWQWDNHGDSDPKSKYDIRIIIFKNISIETVKIRYPINKNKNVDFRYAPYNLAIQYLNEIINEYSESFAVEKYQNLKKKIISHFKKKK